MRLRRLLWLPLVAALVLVATACPAQPSTGGPTTTPTTTPSSCVASNAIPLFGDSNGTQLPQYIHLDGHPVVSEAQGGSTLTEEGRATSFARGNPDLPTIVTRVHDYFAACPVPVALFIQGSTNDWGNEVGSDTVIDTVSDLNAYLSSFNVPTFWISMHPVPHNGSWTAAQIENMTAYNAWLLTPGNVTGTVINSALPLQDPGDVGWLNPAYYSYKTIFAVDPLHMSQSGYAAWAVPLTNATNT